MKTLVMSGLAALALFAATTPSTVHAVEDTDGDGCIGDPGPSRLFVVVEGVRAPARGQIAVSLYPDDKSRFLTHKGKLITGRIDAAAPVTRICLWLQAPGWYAVAAYHDADGNHKFNRNAIGIPTEGFGLSNNPPTPLALPSLSASRFQARAGDNTIHIRLRYP